MLIKSMLSRLAEHPHEYAEISDDNSAVVLLKELLIADKFLQNPAPAMEWFSLLLYADHETHFLAAAKFEGFAEGKDNGHFIHCFPKSSFTAAKVEEEVSRTYAPVIGIERITVKWFPSPKTYN